MNKIKFLDKNIKSILIYNPLSDVGHFDSWCSIFVQILLEKDWVVIVVTKNSKKIFDDLDRNNFLDRSKLLIIDQAHNLNINKEISIIEKIIDKLKIFESLNFFKCNDRRRNQSLFNILISFFARIINFIIKKIENILLKFYLGKVKISACNPIDFASDVDAVVRALGDRPSIILNMYMDLYNPSPKLWEKFSRKMYCIWGGIHMDMSQALKDRPYFQSKSLKVIFTINDPVELNANIKNDDINYQWLPDVTDISLPLTKSQVVKEIENLAAGRKIIYLGGAIGGTKNLSMWSELFFKLNSNEWYFVQIGKIEFPTLSPKDLEALHKLQNEKVERIYISDAYFSDETIFNEVMSISTIIWGLYRNFDRSSNILTKAALLSKPIIVSNRFLMGRRVNTYKIGITVPETDLDALKSGIDWLISNPIPLKNFEYYARIYSASALSQKLNQSLLQFIDQ